MSSDPSASAQPGEPSSTLPTEVKKEEELDASLNPDIPSSTDPAIATQPDAMNLDGSNDMDGQQAPGAPGAPDGIMAGAPPASELRIPTKKDASLREFLSKMDDYAPIVRKFPPLNFFKISSPIGIPRPSTSLFYPPSQSNHDNHSATSHYEDQPPAAKLLTPPPRSPTP